MCIPVSELWSSEFIFIMYITKIVSRRLSNMKEKMTTTYTAAQNRRERLYDNLNVSLIYEKTSLYSETCPWTELLPIRGHLWDLEGRMSFRMSRSTEIPSSTVTLKHSFSPLSGMKKEARSKMRKNNIGSWKLMKCIRGILLTEI